MDSPRSNTQFRSPLFDRHLTAVKDKLNIASARHSLLFGGLPLTVAGLVVSLVFYPAKGVFRGGSWSHIIKELLEIPKPLRAYLNAFGSVILKGCVFGFIAPANHVLPRVVLRGITHAVLPGPLLSEFCGHTAAALRVAASKIASDDRDCSAAVALADPCPFGTYSLPGLTYNKPSEPNTRDIDCFHKPIIHYITEEVNECYC